MINIPSRLVVPMVFLMTSINILIWLTVHLYEGHPLFVSGVASIYFHLDVALAVFLSLAYSRFRDPFAGVMGVVVYFIISELASSLSYSTDIASILISVDPTTLNLFYSILTGLIVGISFNVSSRSGGVFSGNIATIVSLVLALLIGFGLREFLPMFRVMALDSTSGLSSFLSLIQGSLNHPLLSMPYAHLHREFIDSTTGASLSSVSYYNSVYYIMVLGFTSGVLIMSTIVQSIRRNYVFAVVMFYMMISGFLTGINDAFELILLVSAPLIYAVFVGVSVLFLFLTKMFDVQSAIVFAPDAVHYIALRGIFTNEVMLLVLMGAAAALGIGLYFLVFMFTKYRLLGTAASNYD